MHQQCTRGDQYDPVTEHISTTRQVRCSATSLLPLFKTCYKEISSFK